MKKLFTLIAMAFAIITFTSCNQCSSPVPSNTNGFNFLWDAEATAVGEGVVSIGFPTGFFTLNGNASFVVNSCSDTTQGNGVEYTVEQALTSNNPQLVEFAQAVEESNSAFYVKELSGTWSVDINVRAVQPETGFVIIIVKHWPDTNAVASEPVPVAQDGTKTN